MSLKDNYQMKDTAKRGRMPIYRDYEIRINLNELIEKRIPACKLTHKDHCLTESQIADIAHDINMDLNLHPIYEQIDKHIMAYVNAANIDNSEHWVEEKLPDLNGRDFNIDERSIDFD